MPVMVVGRVACHGDVPLPNHRGEVRHRGPSLNTRGDSSTGHSAYDQALPTQMSPERSDAGGGEPRSTWRGAGVSGRPSVVLVFLAVGGPGCFGGLRVRIDLVGALELLVHLVARGGRVAATHLRL